MLTLVNDESVDYSYLKIQLPNRISGYKLGYAQEGYTNQQPGPVGLQAIEMGRNSGGECDVIQLAVNNTIDIQSATAGNVIVVHISKISPHSSIMGALANPDYGSSEKHFEGSYEYTILGQRVQRAVRFQDLGVADAK